MRNFAKAHLPTRRTIVGCLLFVPLKLHTNCKEKLCALLMPSGSQVERGLHNAAAAAAAAAARGVEEYERVDKLDILDMVDG
jgi:hypothetical protein